MSSERSTGEFLAVLAATVSAGGRILEIGTGVGLGTAALVSAIHPRTDVRIVTIEIDQELGAIAQDNDWPSYVTFIVGDAVALLPDLGGFDLIYADAPGGKWTGLDGTISALAPGGILVVDDMLPLPTWSEETVVNQHRARQTLLTHPDLTAVEIPWSTGLIIAAQNWAVTACGT